MKRITLILMFLSVITVSKLIGSSAPVFNAAKTSICYEEVVTIADLFTSFNDAYNVYLQVKLESGSYVQILSYTSGMRPPVTTVLNLKNNTDLANVAYATSGTITVRVWGNHAPTSGTDFDLTKTYTFSRGYDDNFNLLAETPILNSFGYPSNEPINLAALTPSGGQPGSSFESTTATIENSTGWKYYDLSPDMNQWNTLHGITFHPVKYNGCGIESVVKTTTLTVPIQFKTIPHICRTEEKVNLDNFLEKPKSIAYSEVVYEGKFSCEDFGSAVVDNYFYPNLIPEGTNQVIIRYDYYQKSPAPDNTIKQQTYNVFTIFIDNAPVAPVITSNDSIYCKGNTAHISLSNLTGNDVFWFTSDDTIPDVHPFTILNIQETKRVTAAYKGFNGCYSKTEVIVPVDTVHAEFTISDATPTTDQTITFDASYNGGSRYTWDLEDGPDISGDLIDHYFNMEGSYDVALTVKSVNGCEAELTKENAIVVSDETAINSGTTEYIAVWPQPVSSELHVTIPGISQAILSITDLSGKTVFSKNITDKENTIDVSGLSQGMFILTVRTSDKVYVTRFIKD